MVGASEIQHTYTHYGAASDLFWYRSKEIVLEGPAGTGKSRACLEKLHAVLQRYPGARGLMLRKTLTSLTAAAIVTYKQKVLQPFDGVTFFHGSREEPAQFRYPNGSVLVVGGLDKSEKVMSTEYDLIYIQEATEVTDKDWEDCTTRLRNGAVPYQQLIADCNPQEPTHWLKQRGDRGQTRMLASRHEDNPTLWDCARGDWTEFGRAYIATLDALTGVRKQRLRHGIWAAAEGLVYEEFDERVHLIDTAPPGLRSFFAAQDWGYTNPGVCLVFGEDGDGRLYLVAQHYMTQQTMAWWIPRVQALHRQYHLQTIQCDPSEPGFIADYQNAGLPAVKATNAIAPGVGAVRQRLAVAADGKPRLYICRDSLRERDESLVAAHAPFAVEQEFASFVWPKDRAGQVVKETPAPGIDHGMDALRYGIVYRDGTPALTFAAPLEIERTSPWASPWSG